MSSSFIPTTWRVADVTFLEFEICHPSARPMRVELEGGVQIVISDPSQVALAAALIETLRAGKEVFR